MPPAVLTIGHSNHPLDRFLAWFVEFGQPVAGPRGRQGIGQGPQPAFEFQVRCQTRDT
jgi:hypothetical protein